MIDQNNLISEQGDIIDTKIIDMWNDIGKIGYQWISVTSK